MSDVEQAKAHFFAALDLLDAKDFASAEKELRAALAIVPDRVSALSNLAVALFEQDKVADAIATAERALSFEPDDVETLLVLGSARARRGEIEPALAAMNRAATLAPTRAEVLVGRASVHVQAKRYDLAIADLREARRFGGTNEVTGRLLLAQQHACDWSDFDALVAELLSGFRDGSLIADPFAFLSVPGASPADLLLCAKSAITRDYPARAPHYRGEVWRSDRIRIAYVSGDFRAHPTSHVLPGMLEQHDRDRFEVFAFSTSKDDDSAPRKRIAAAVDHFVDAFQWTDEEIVKAIGDSQIDIAVDLSGFTDGGRMRVFARRAAPIQVNYLGFPATFGAPYFDYILCDRIVVPQGHEAYYAEKRVWLPDTYHANDDKRVIAPQTLSRADAGLPADAFVFCSFNSGYKITPAIFDVWMRILAAVPGSVLWLYRNNAMMEVNLRREASARGVDPARIVFAGPVPVDQHLARHALADLCLDTAPYNAHSTACDTLWAGVPIVTHPGETFPSRVAASLLNAVGLSELIAPGVAEYTALAIDLARNPERLAAVKAKLAANRLNMPLFDTRRLTRHIESAYTTMVERHRRGEPPAPFEVAPIP
jgi:predicted O-linked N-acetylglucosamine transferase (SPINDLY family)